MEPITVAAGMLLFPDPTDPSRSVTWLGTNFDLDGKRARVLGYDVAPSGWSDELTELHEATGGSDHFIDVASRDYALKQVEGAVRRKDAVILEIGASSGFLLAALAARFGSQTIVGADYTRGTLEALGKRLEGVPLLQFDLTRCPLPDAFADAVIALNVLEHIEDHEAAVAHLFRILRPSGTAIIEVPAGSNLFDVYDHALMHFRRYDMPDLVELFETAGFHIERKSHLGFVLYPAFYLSKRLNQFRYPDPSAVSAKDLATKMIADTKKNNTLGRLAMQLEEVLRPMLPYPRGIRCLITAVKPAAGEKH
jgi:SAM-dependent methyltransferase